MEHGIPPPSSFGERRARALLLERLWKFESSRLYQIKAKKMKKALVLLLFVCNAWAEETPYDRFTAEKNLTNSTTVTWQTVDNVKSACDAENTRRGFGSFQIGNRKMEACSFRDKVGDRHTCLVITGKSANYWDIGHEVRHCFQGKFHQ